MNIFLTDPDPTACAVALDNSRVVKMVLETAQLLSAVGFGLSARPRHEVDPFENVSRFLRRRSLNTFVGNDGCWNGLSPADAGKAVEVIGGAA